MGEKIVGVDIGATKIKIGLVQDGKVIKEQSFPTASKAAKEQILFELCQGIEQIAGTDFSGIGVGVPGLIDETNGVIFDLLNIPSWKEVYLKDYLENNFKKPVKITNDANVFAIGEKNFGAGKEFENFIGITLGSGFGCGIIINGELYSGAFSSAGEFGSIPYLDKTIEDYCSGKFFESNGGMTGEEIFHRAETGDKRAQKLFSEYGNHLGNAIQLILHILAPQAIIFGGSITASYSHFQDALEKNLDSFLFKKVRNQLAIKISSTSDNALLGCAALIMHKEPAVEKKSVSKRA